MNDKELKIILIKAELFDLQIELGSVKQKIAEKLRELNTQPKEKPDGK
ncbi:MAG: hypothetical protein WC750_06010 [Patescibacteria group bacterium]